MSAVTFGGVTKSFGDTIAVDDLTLEVERGEFLVVLGPSGCGKSTALRLLAGLETPDSGSIEIDGRVVNDVDPRHRDVAMVFQSYALYPHMTVARNIESPLIGRRSESTDRASRTDRVRHAATMLGLDQLLDRKPGQLSGGQRQRVALARAIVREPAVFCMDEPLSNLDAKLRAHTRSELVDLHARLATTFVYVTHDQAEAMSMASRIAVLDDGRLQQLDDPRTVYTAPTNEFVARFVGNPTMNLIGGEVEIDRDGSRWVTVAGGRFAVDGSWTVAEGQPVQVGIRPEHLRPSAQGLPVVLGAVEWLGHEQIVTVHGDSGSLAMRAPEDDRLASGSTITVSCPPASLHLFDRGTGRRLPRAEVGS